MIEGLVSIVMPAYNCAKFLPETIASVQKQTYENWELRIVDDCSTDDTRQVVQRIGEKDSRVKYCCLAQNSGPAAARTRAMELAEGEYIAFLDSDDLWLPEKLEKQLRFMRENGYAFVCCDYEQVDEDGKPLGKVVRTIPKTDYRRLLLDCPVGNSTVVYSVKALGKFSVPDIRKRNDDALWLKMLKQTPFIYGQAEVLAQYRLRRGSVSEKKLDLVKYHWILYRQIEGLNVFTSAFHVCWWGVIKLLHLK